MRKCNLKKAVSGILAGAMVLSLTLTGVGPFGEGAAQSKVLAAEVAVAGGSGTQSDPYQVSLTESGEHSFQLSGSGSRIYARLICQAGATVEIKSVDANGLSNGSLFGDGNSQLDRKVTVPTDGMVNFSVGGYTGSGVTIKVKYSGGSAPTGGNDSSSTGTTTTGVSGSDLTNCTTPTKVSQSEKEAWYTFTITKASTIEFETENPSGSYFAVFDANGKYAMTEQNMPGNASSGYTMVHQYTEDIGARFDDLLANNPAADGKCAKISFYEPGTYKIRLRNMPTSAGNYGFKSFMIRDYKPISSLEFKSGGKTYKNGSTIMVKESSGDIYVDVSFVEKSYQNSDGRPYKVKLSNSNLKVRESATNPLSNFYFKGGKFGSTKVTVLDERGQEVGSYTAKIKPVAVQNGCITAQGTSTSVTVNNSMTSSNAKKMRVYIKQGSKFVLKGTYNNGRAKVTGLKPNKIYKIKVTNYDAPTKAESDMSQVFTICTAPSQNPVIKSIGKISRSYGQSYTTDSTFPYARHYYYYTHVSGKIQLKSKIKGANGLEIISNRWQSQSSMNKASFSAILAGSQSKNAKPSCSGTAKIKVRGYKKAGCCISYTKWSTVKVVKF